MDEPAPSTRRHGAVAIVVRQGQFLVIRRSQTVVAPGAYCFPGGGIERGESEAEALVRELREELGVTVQPRDCLWRSVTPWDVALSWWQSDLEPGAVPVPNPAEVESIHWLTPHQMRRLPGLLESNLAFLDALDRAEIELGV